MSEDHGVLFFVVALALPMFIIGAIAWHMQRVQAQNNSFRQLARLLGGKFVQGSFIDPWEVTFHHGDTWGRIDAYRTGGGHSSQQTRVRIAWSDASVRCEIFPEQVVHRMGKLLGMVDLEIGDPTFDRNFIIYGDNRQRIKLLLTPEVRRLLFSVYYDAEHKDMYFSISRNEILLRKRGVADDVRELEKFARTAMAIYDELTGGAQQGIQFIDDPPRAGGHAAAEATAGVCQICGEEIAADPVLCKTCRTPHHHDCWEYYGQCSTFGCRERGYVRPRRQAAKKGRK